ncbi:MAG: hypothetical protein JWR19_4551 [Pedosphaera sp.]|nr:hypothetical protein [Pedosphaera sp.]
MKIWIVLVLLLSSVARADDFAALVRDRAAIERVYYQHRLGQKPPFEETLPPAALEKLVRLDLNKEAVLRKKYSIVITPAMIEAEVQRINSTTRAPEMLAELKAALGNDPIKFANVFAKPILVERDLHVRFENDDALHAAQRREGEQVRTQLLATQNSGADGTNRLALLQQSHRAEVSELTWQLGARPAETNAPDAELLEAQKRFGPNAQVLSAPQDADKERKLYFMDLPDDLQSVLQAQLRRAGDVSAVIETPGGFLFYLAKEKTSAILNIAVLSIPKRDYEQWLADEAGQIGK